MAHAFKKVALFAAVVSLGSATAAPAFVGKVVAGLKAADAQQRAFFNSSKGNLTLGALVVANAAVYNGKSMPALKTGSTYVNAVKAIPSVFSPAPAFPLTWNGYTPSTKQVGTAQVGTAQVGTAQVGTAQVGNPGDAHYVAASADYAPASADYAPASADYAPASADYAPATKGTWGKPALKTFEGKALAVGTLRGVTLVALALKAFNAVRDYRDAKKAAAATKSVK